MILKDDCIGLLVRLEDEGVSKIEVNKNLSKLLTAKDMNDPKAIEVLKFIAANKGIAAINFFEGLRQKHNKHNSPLYTNIMNFSLQDIDGSINGNEVATTLASLLTQIFLYNSKIDDSLFLKQVRANEIANALAEYSSTGDLTKCMSLLAVIKSDIMVLEYLNDRRELSA